MTDTKSPVNRVWLSVEAGNFNIGSKAAIFFGADTAAEVLDEFKTVFDDTVLDAVIVRLQSAAIGPGPDDKQAVDNLKQQGVISSDPSAPVCDHGAMVKRTSKPGAAKQWAAWMCTAPQGDPTQCKPRWI